MIATDLQPQASSLRPVPEHWPVESLDEYHADTTCHGNTALSMFDRNPWAFYLQRVRGLPWDVAEPDYFALGRVFHAAVQHPDARLDELCDIQPEEIKQRRGTKWEEFKAEHAGRPILRVKEAKLVSGMLASIMDNPEAVELLGQPGRVEHAIRWRHESGVGLKCCFDFIPDSGDWLPDFKTAANAAEESWPSELADKNYHRQAALSLLGQRLYLGRETDAEFVHIVVGKTPPHECFVRWLSPRAVKCGMFEVERIIERLAACLEFSDTDTPAVWHSPGWTRGRGYQYDLPEWHYRKLVT